MGGPGPALKGGGRPPGKTLQEGGEEAQGDPVPGWLSGSILESWLLDSSERQVSSPQPQEIPRALTSCHLLHGSSAWLPASRSSCPRPGRCLWGGAGDCQPPLHQLPLSPASQPLQSSLPLQLSHVFTQRFAASQLTFLPARSSARRAGTGGLTLLVAEETVEINGVRETRWW